MHGSTIGVHGNSFVRAQRGSQPAEQVGGVPWTDLVGLHRGDGVVYQLRTPDEQPQPWEGGAVVEPSFAYFEATVPAVLLPPAEGSGTGHAVTSILLRTRTTNISGSGVLGMAIPQEISIIDATGTVVFVGSASTAGSHNLDQIARVLTGEFWLTPTPSVMEYFVPVPRVALQQGDITIRVKVYYINRALFTIHSAEIAVEPALPIRVISQSDWTAVVRIYYLRQRDSPPARGPFDIPQNREHEGTVRMTVQFNDDGSIRIPFIELVRYVTTGDPDADLDLSIRLARPGAGTWDPTTGNITVLVPVSIAIRLTIHRVEGVPVGNVPFLISQDSQIPASTGPYSALPGIPSGSGTPITAIAGSDPPAAFGDLATSFSIYVDKPPFFTGNIYFSLHWAGNLIPPPPGLGAP